MRKQKTGNKKSNKVVIADKEPANQNKNKEKRAAELTIANKELVFQKKEKKMRAAELIIANELIIQNEEKEKHSTELIVSETRYRRLFEAAKDGILILDVETGIITDVNPFLIELLGYTKEEFVDKEIWEIGFFKDVVANKEKFIELQKEEYVRYHDLLLETKDGRKINVEFVSNVYTEGDHRVIQCNIRDMTERKKAEVAIRESEETFRRLFNESADSILLLDDTGFIECNQSAASILGYSSTKDVLIKQPWEISPEKQPDGRLSTEKAAAMIAKAVQQGYNRFEWVHTKEDGTEFAVEVMLTPIILNGKQTLYTIWRDISERKKAEEKLKISEQRYHDLFHQANEGLLIMTPEGQLSDLNQAFAQMHGYTVDELKNYDIRKLDVLGEKTLDDRADHVGSILAGEVVRFEVEHYHKDGHIFPLSVTASLAKIGGQEFFLAFHQDITRRKKAEEEHIRLSKAIFNSGEVVFMTDKEGILIFINPEFTRLYGYTAEEVVGKCTPRILKSNQSTKEGYESFWNTLLSKKNISINQYVNKCKDGRLINIEGSAQPILNDKNEIIGFLAIQRDISERKKAEEALLQSEADYRGLFENNSAVKLIIDPDTGLLHDMNQAAVEFYGWTRETMKKMKIHQINVSDSYKELSDRLKKSEKIESFHFEVKHKLADGSIRDIEVYGNPITMAGKVFIHSIMFDITERKKMEVELQKSEALNKRIIESSEDCFKILDMEGKLVFMSEGGQRLFEISDLSVYLNKPYLDFWDRPYKHAIQTAIEKAKNGTSASVKGFCPTEKGSPRWWSVIISPMVSVTGKIESLLVVSRDITRQKALDDALQESELKYRELVENSPDAIVIYINGKIVFVNRASISLMAAASKEELIGKPVLPFVHSDYIPVVMERMKKIIREQVALPPMEEKFIRLDGSVVDVEVNAMPVRFENQPAVQMIIRDITERKQAEKVLQESEARLIDAQAVSKVGSWETNLSDLKVIWSAETYRIFELDPNSFQASHPAFLEFVHPEDRKNVEEKFAASIENKSDNNVFEHRIIASSGTIKFVEERWRIVHDAQRKQMLAIGTCQDITERKQAEENLKKNEEIFRTILDNAPIGIWMLDGDGHMLFVNKEFCNSVGISEKRFLEVPHYAELYTPEIAAACIASDNTAIAEAGLHVSYEQLPFTDGKIHDVEIYKIRLLDKQNNYTGLIGLMRDITKQKQAEEKLIESRQNYKSLLENMNDAFVTDDILGRVVFTNKKFLEMFGFREDQINSLNLESFIAPEYIEIIKDRHSRRMAGEKVPDVFEFEGLRKDGKRIWLETHVNPIIEKEMVIGTQSILRDITDRKNSEEELNKFALELQASNTELERFAYIASHDLKEPLRMVSSFLNLLEQKLGDKLLDKTDREYIHFAVDGATRMKTLINDLLQYSRVGQNIEKFLSVDTKEIMEYVRRTLQDDIEKTGAVIKVKALPVITASKTLFSQLLMNLVSNALKYHGDKPLVIEVGCMEEQDKYIFYVKDNGIGIESRFFEKIFIIFQRLHGQHEYSGTGIGLAICRKIVEIHKGKIWVESELGKGSTFYFSLPAEQAGLPK